MRVDGRPMRPIRALTARDGVLIIDQRALPHELKLVELRTPRDVFAAIREMWLRGAPLIGAAAAYGLALALRDDARDAALQAAAAWLREARPTTVKVCGEICFADGVDSGSLRSLGVRLRLLMPV